MRHRVIEHILHDSMKKILLSVSVLALAAACDSNPTGPTKAVGPNVPGPTFDDIGNTLDASVDATAEVMPLNAGGPNGTTTLTVTPRNGDGKNGCNLTASTTLTVSVSSNNTAVATVSVSPTATFTSCGDTKTLTVTPLSVGSATITVAQVSNNTGASFDFTTATFTVNVASPPPSNTAPTLTISGVTNGSSYDKGSVPAAMCNVTDAEDGNSSFPATLTAISGPYSSDGIGMQTASCSYTDAGGLNAAESVTYNIVDPSPPTIEYTLSPASPDGNNGWYKSNVALTWNVSEPDSPNSVVKTGCVDQNITADQGPTQYSCTAASAGGSASAGPVTIKRDATAPTINGTPSPAANGFGWNNTDVVVNFTCGDNLSGVANCGPDQTLSGEGAGQSATGNAEDNAGNTASATVSNINIDKTAPNVSLVGGPGNGGSYYFGSVPLAPTCSASDGLSGLDGSCSVTGYGTTVGSHTVTATAKDKAGNESTATATYTVLAWTLKGFYQPVDMNGVVNTVKGGSTVPLKFEIFAGSSELTDVSAIDAFKVAMINCGDAGTVSDEIELLTTGGTTLRYDATGGQFIQNWQTPKLPGFCFKVTMTTDDGSSISALFKLK